MMQKVLLKLMLLLAFPTCITLSALDTTSTVTRDWEEVVHYAKSHLPQAGVLVMKSDGFGYIKVDDNYIHELLPLLSLEDVGYKEPPYFRSKESPGAHISVFYEDEHVLPEEVGKNFSFTLEKIVEVRPSRKVGYVVFQVNSPELEALREKYHLSPKLHGYEFHITIGKKSYSH